MSGPGRPSPRTMARRGNQARPWEASRASFRGEAVPGGFDVRTGPAPAPGGFPRTCEDRPPPVRMLARADWVPPHLRG